MKSIMAAAGKAVEVGINHMTDQNSKTSVLKKIRLAVTVSISLMMVVVLLVVYMVNKTEVAQADYGLTPFWDSLPTTGQPHLIGPWDGPIQNTQSSRLYAFVHNVGGVNYDRFYRVNDDGTVVLGDQLANPGGEFEWHWHEIQSDGLDGAYLAKTHSQLFGNPGGPSSVVRVNGNGNQVWQKTFGFPMYSMFRGLLTASDGNALFFYRTQNGRICGMKLNRTSSNYMWSSSVANCPTGVGRAAHSIYDVPGQSLRLIAQVSDGAGGAVLFLTTGDLTNNPIFAVRVNGADGSVVWSKELTAKLQGDTKKTRLRDAVVYNNEVYFTAYEYTATDKRMLLYKLMISDGSEPWPEVRVLEAEAQFSILAGWSRSDIVLSGDGELTYSFAQVGSNDLYMNRVNLETGSKKWPEAVLVRQATVAGNTRRLFAGAQGTVYLAFCESNTNICDIQGTDPAGNLIFSSGGVDVNISRDEETSFGHHWYYDAGNDAYLSCIDQGIATVGAGGQPVQAQMYCLNSLPTITDPICSINDGADFGLCGDAQQGSVLSHVRVSCDPGMVQPFSEGALANDPNKHEESPEISGQYVVYMQLPPNDVDAQEIVTYDLGPDMVFGTFDDGARTQITNNVWRDVPTAVNENRAVVVEDIGATKNLRIYDLSTGATHPGSLQTTSFHADLRGRYLYYQPVGTYDIYQVDLGPDQILGTGDDGVSEQITTSDLGNTRFAANDRYIVAVTSEARSQIKLIDIASKEEFSITDNPAVQAWSPDLDGRYVVWSDFRNDPDGGNNPVPPLNNGDIFIYDLGPDEQYSTADDVGEVQLSVSAKTEFSPRISGTRIVWTCDGCDGGDDGDIYSYDLGTDGLYGTADDSGIIQITQSPHRQSGPKIDGQNLLWTTNELGFLNDDIIITPIGTAAANIDQVRFTLNAPSGDKYTDLEALDIVGNTYTLDSPVLIDEVGQWTIDATCEDIAGQTDTSQVQWDVGDWPFSFNQKLSVYDGIIQIAHSDGDAMEIGNAGHDLASTGNIYFRPNNSLAGSAWEGTADAPYQRLHFPFGIVGQPTILAKGSGTLDTNNGASAIASFFDGNANNAGGSAVYGEVISCANAGGCASGYFSAGSQVGILAETQEASTPALKVANSSGADPSDNVSALFEGHFVADGDIVSDKLKFTECHWETLVWSELVCPNDGFVFGYEDNDPGEFDRIYCCGNP